MIREIILLMLLESVFQAMNRRLTVDEWADCAEAIRWLDDALEE